MKTGLPEKVGLFGFEMIVTILKMDVTIFKITVIIYKITVNIFECFLT